MENIQLEKSHLLCDNPECDYKHFDNIDYNDLEKWIDFSCPKCGESLLTKEDYNTSNQTRDWINFLNTLTEDEITNICNSIPQNIKDQSKKQINEDLGIDVHNISKDTKISMFLHIHNGVNLLFQKCKKMIIGSTAIKYWFPDFNRKPKDLDIVYRDDEDKTYLQTKEYIRETRKMELLHNPVIIAYAKAKTGSIPKYCPADLLYTLKISHSFWDLNNKSWDKHLWDINFLKEKGCKFDRELFNELFEFWSKMHGKRMDSFEKTAKIIRKDDISANEFFNNNVNNKIDHDDYHDILIKHPYFEGQVEPTYRKVLMDFEEVDVSEEKFNRLTEKEKFNLVFEEIIVMSTEPRFPENMYWKEKYRIMLKNFILKHCKVWQGIWIIQNHKLLLTKIPFNGIKYLNENI